MTRLKNQLADLRAVLFLLPEYFTLNVIIVGMFYRLFTTNFYRREMDAQADLIRLRIKVGEYSPSLTMTMTMIMIMTNSACDAGQIFYNTRNQINNAEMRVRKRVTSKRTRRALYRRRRRRRRILKIHICILDMRGRGCGRQAGFVRQSRRIK